MAARLIILVALLVFIVAFHWLERGSLKDNLDGHVSFSDVIYFTMISVTTTGLCPRTSPMVPPASKSAASARA